MYLLQLSNYIWYIRSCHFRSRYIIRHCQVQFSYFIKYCIWYFKKGLQTFSPTYVIESSVSDNFFKNFFLLLLIYRIAIYLTSPCLAALLSLLCPIISLKIWAFKKYLIDIIFKNWLNTAQLNWLYDCRFT